jgi:thiol:disulfide interchange protein DsbD
MKKLLLPLLLLFITQLYSEGFGGFEIPKQQSFLKPSDAFKVNAKQGKDSLNVDIILGDKIHIYKNKLKFSITKPTQKVLNPTLPKAKVITGEEAYDSNLTITIPNSQLGVSGSYELKVDLSGCSDAGICYAPQSYTFTLEAPKNMGETKEAKSAVDSSALNKGGFFDKIATLVKQGNSKDIAQALKSEGLIFVLLLFFIVGLLLALTPCILPMIPILSSILLQQANRSGGEIKRGTAFTISLVYVVAMAASYAVIGIVAGLLHFDLQANLNNPWVIFPVAAIFIALAFSLFGYFEIALPSKLQSKLNNVSNSAQGKGLIGTAIMGAISALIVGACTAPVISGAIVFISATGDALLGGLALFVMGIGAGVPLLLVGVGAKNLVPKPGGWMENVSKVFGVLMLLMALYVLRGIISPTLYIYLFSILLIGTAIMFKVFDSSNSSGVAGVFKVLNFLVLLYGVILFIGAVSGATSIFDPLEKLKGTSVAIKAQSSSDSKQQYTLQTLLEEIKKEKRPVVVDIGKDNCAACTELEEITFPNPKVKEAMKRFRFIQLDITKYTKDDQAIMKHFDIFGAPNILFFNSKGEPIENLFQQGFVKPERFVEILNTIK